MKVWKSSLAVILAVSVFIFTGPDIPSYAKGGGGGRSSSSFSSSRSSSFGSSRSSSSFSYSKSSSGYSKPTSNTWGSRSGGGFFSSTSKTTVTTSSGYSKPTTAPSSSGYTKPTSAGYSKPSSNAPPTSSGFTKPTSTSSSGYAKPTAASVVSTAPQKITFSSANKSKFDASAAKEQRSKNSAASLAAYEANKKAYKQPEKPFNATTYSNSALYKSAPAYRGYNTNTQVVVRNNYYSHMGYHPPAYYTSFSPSYGLFDTMFMFWMIDNMHTNAEARRMAYNYQNDAGFRQFRDDLNKQSANNDELKKKIATMDAEMAKMKEQKQPVDPNYVPKDIPAEVMVSPQAMREKETVKPVVVMATGQSSGRYNMFGEMLQRNATEDNIKVVPSSGSMENLRLLVSGKADMALVQSDALGMFSKEFPKKQLKSEQTVVYPEFMQIIVNSGSGIKSLSDMLNGKTEICFPKGSGSEVSWNALCDQDPAYKKIPVNYVTSNDKCLEEVSRDLKLALFLVTGLKSPILNKAEKIAADKGTLRMATVNDKSLLDKLDDHGNRVYTYYEIPSNTYPALQKSWWLFHREIATIGVDAVLVLNSSWAESHGADALEVLTLAVMQTKSEFEKDLFKN